MHRFPQEAPAKSPEPGMLAIFGRGIIRLANTGGKRIR